jgi:hypothetical protein
MTEQKFAKIISVVSEKEADNLEKGWYVKVDGKIVAGPYEFLWQANERSKAY